MSSKDINPSTTSLQSTDTATSTTPLTQPGKRKQKNFPFALANLQEKYGTSGNVYHPMAGRQPPQTSSSSLQSGNAGEASSPTPSTSKPSSLSTIQEQPPPLGGAKNFEAAFGSLSSSYGVSSALPTLPRKEKQKEKDTKEKPLFSKSFFSRKGALHLNRMITSPSLSIGK